MPRVLLLIILIVVSITPVRADEWDNVKEDVKERLRDPDSAQFRNLVRKTQVGTQAIVCGELNSKNLYGGYVGFRLFAHVSDSSGRKAGVFFSPEADRIFCKD